MTSANCQEGAQLLLDGAIALAEIEANGIRVDVDRLQRTRAKLAVRLRGLREEMETTDVWRMWRRRFGSKAKLTSLPQLGDVLHTDLKFKIQTLTETGRPKMDEENLQLIDHPFVKKYARFLKYSKAQGTFLKGIEKELDGDRLHPFFSLHTARSFRSSSSAPNFQNFPVRDKEISKIIRSQFIASRNSVLVENDFKGIEVALSAAYHHDPVFISYINTPGKDMHKDMAAQIYCLKPSEVSKDARYGAKNKFVFPEFYGDYYVSCAKSLWDWIGKGNLATPEGVSLYEHLESEGIEALGKCDPEAKPIPGTFEHHLREVENDFWNRRFKVYGQWKRDWYDRYLERGYFDLKTGFRIEGFLSRNQVINLPVQGSAFHCLLWSLIQVVRLMRKYKMRSKVVGQIHDSLVGDIRTDELRDYLNLVEQVTTVDLPKHYPWMVVPPQIEYEICPENGNWYQKREFHFKDGRFYHPEHPTQSTRDVVRFLETIKQSK